jgi:hypothetical protein
LRQSAQSWTGAELPSLDAIRAEIASRAALAEHTRFLAKAEDLRSSLLAWAIEVLKDFDQTPARHHRLVMRELEAVSRGDVDRLMLMMPRGSAKSRYASQIFPPWWLARHPRSAIIAASHTAELAEHFARIVRNMVLQHANSLGFTLSADSKAAGRWETSLGGEYFAVGVGGAVVGRRGDLGLIDDPIKSREDAESGPQRDKIWNWYKADFYPCLKPNARIVLVMTHWHEDDLAGRLLEEMAQGKDQWRVIKLPALATAVDDPLERAIGEPLWPEWESLAQIERKRAAIGEREFGALFQQEPRAAGTSFFDMDSALLDGLPVSYPTICSYVFATLDTAVKTGKHNDGTAICYWALNKFDKFHPLTLLDYDILQIEGSLLEVWLPSTATRLEELAAQCRARMGSQGIFIEDKASGSILLQQAARRDIMAHAIESGLTAKGKDERAISVSGYVTSGMVKISQHAFDKTLVYKGRSGNHLLMQVFRFQLGVPDQQDDLLDTWCYGIAISLGDSEGF